MEYLFLALFVGAGLLFLVGGIPLMLGRVGRNQWYGFRTTSSLADDAIWYPTNRRTGQCASIGGVVLIVSTLVLWTMKLSPLGLAVVGLAICTAIVLFMVIATVTLQTQLLRARAHAQAGAGSGTARA